MYKLLTTIIATLFAATLCSAQEFTDTRSNDLLNSLKTRFVRECGQSPFLVNYNEANAKFAKRTKNVNIKRGEYYQKEILIEKGYIIAQTENSPFEKIVETFNIDIDGRLYRSSKRTTRMSGDEILMEETDITSFAYGDTLQELHNYHSTPARSRCDFNYSYIHDSLGLVVKKISNTHINHIDTTYYEYDSLRRVIKETLGNKTVICYEYNNEGLLSVIKRTSQDQEEMHTTRLTYNVKKQLISVSLQESYTHTELRLGYDEHDNLVWFDCKTNDGEETIAELCHFEYNKMGHISKDCKGFKYKYKYDKHGNWTRCDISREGKRIERINRKIRYSK